MAQELLRYRPTNVYDAWLARITELIKVVGDAPTPSRSLPSPSSRDARARQDAPPPPRATTARHANVGSTRLSPPTAPLRRTATTRATRSSSARLDAWVLLEMQLERQNRTIQEVTTVEHQNRAALAGGVVSTVGGCMSSAVWCGP